MPRRRAHRIGLERAVSGANVSLSLGPLEPLTAISPLDGRYRERVAALAPLVSEFGLLRYRVRVEVEWFLHLATWAEIAELPPVDAARAAQARAIWRGFSVRDAAEVRRLEARTNHDVKAVEYFVKQRLGDAVERPEHLEFVHFGCTSEDVNNLAYGLMITDVRRQVLLPALRAVEDDLRALARPLADAPMLARTHGQAASPTTAGKELANFVARLARQRERFAGMEVLGKMNGAVGNYNAHHAAYPNVDWPRRCREFVTGLGLTFNPHTTQIEPHDQLAEWFHCLTRYNQVLLDLDRDLWGYIALGYFRQRTAPGEVGSSTMPHKVNPIDFENSEGNIGVANALLGHLAAKLPVSRWQRDLSDSTALRNIGAAFAHCVLAYDSARRGLAKLALDAERCRADLTGAWEVLAEAVQTVMRAHGQREPYERLKALTRGRRLDERVYREVLDALDLPPAALRDLAALTPAAYTGLAPTLAENALAEQPAAVREVPWASHQDALCAVRIAVFVDEQGIDRDEELDGEDAASRHFLAQDADGHPIGAARLLPNGQIGRMAVLPAWRRRGVGAQLLGCAVAAAQTDGLPVFLHAQADAVPFYERNGFAVVGDVFEEANIDHRKMIPSAPAPTPRPRP